MRISDWSSDVCSSDLTGWQEAYGSSGTAKGLIAVLQEGGMSKKGITLEGLEKLKDKLVRDGKVIMSELPGLKHDRSLVLAGGLAIMMAAFKELKVKAMGRSEEHTSELQSLMRISYAVFCLK